MKAKERSCAMCKREAKCRLREISWQAWSLLLGWHEVDQFTVAKPLCDTCYTELRNILIDRSAEVEAAMRGMSKPENSTTFTPSPEAVVRSRPVDF